MNKADKEKFDTLLRIADFNIHQFNERRDYSWKVALAFWGAVIGSIAIVSRTRSAIPPAWALILAAVVILLLHVYWLYGVFKADEKDKQLAFAARDQAFDANSVLGRPIMDALRNGLEYDPPVTFLTRPQDQNRATWWRFI